jgi:hypothetical protein
MPAQPDEIQRRELAARRAIKRAFESDDDEMNARLFVSHHLAELDSDYWKRHFSVEKPSPDAVLDALVLRSHWGGDDEVDAFDFTLPEDATNYVLCVRFDGQGQASEVVLES